MIVAISTHPESEQVERLGHPVPVLLIDVEGMTIKETRLLEAEGHNNDQLIAGLSGSDVLICAGIEDADAERLQALGVNIAVLRAGIDASAALTWYVHQANGGGCGCGEHGCGNHSESKGGCGCDDSKGGCGCNESRGGCDDSKGGCGCGCN